MATADNRGMTITRQQVAVWRKQAADLLKMAEAAELLLASQPQSDGPIAPAGTNGAANGAHGEHGQGSNFMGTLVRLANESPRPIPRSELKEALRKLGFAERQLGRYFYVALKKTSDAERISLRDDGTVWKGTRL